MTTKRRQAPANSNRLQPTRPSNYEFMPYTGTGTEVVDDLTIGAAPSWRLLQIARWHDAKHAGRNGRIANTLRHVAGRQDDARAAAQAVAA
ncbi:hypothetical protein GGE68_002990 [Rhizobium leguminosarum]|uniref:hypothetical protein n=1 Tax=Rhizobium leguminosarum TaxID=384 RepID=UPI0016130BC6|nr:hypothetical protein [Rhizobium leguminosarum]MBB5664793.1 hypothetical protein [Rhizobium leguminosarum]